MTQVSQLIAAVVKMIHSLTPERVKYWMENLKQLKEILVGGVSRIAGAAKNVFVVNFSLPRASALALGKFKWVAPSLADGPFPLGEGEGQKTLVPDLVGGLGYCKNTAEAQEKLAAKLRERGLGEKPMTPREFAAFAGAYPELCQGKWIGILGSVGWGAGGRQCVACFDGTGGDWDLGLDLVRDDWGDDGVFAVSREL